MARQPLKRYKITILPKPTLRYRPDRYHRGLFDHIDERGKPKMNYVLTEEAKNILRKRPLRERIAVMKRLVANASRRRQRR